MREERKTTITDLYMKAYTAEEIGAAVGLTKQQANDDVCQFSAELRKSYKVQFSDESFIAPIYNVWSFAKKTNKTDHFGNTEQRMAGGVVGNVAWDTQSEALFSSSPRHLATLPDPGIRPLGLPDCPGWNCPGLLIITTSQFWLYNN